jgi:hypothetical protein
MPQTLCCQDLFALETAQVSGAESQLSLTLCPSLHTFHKEN